MLLTSACGDAVLTRLLSRQVCAVLPAAAAAAAVVPDAEPIRPVRRVASVSYTHLTLPTIYSV